MSRKKSSQAPSAPAPTARRYDAAEEKSRNTVGRRIAEARRRKGLSIAAFSRYLEHFGVEITTGGAGKWETGATVPSAYQLMAISAALEIDHIEAFFADEFRSSLDAEGERKVAEYRADLIATGKYRSGAGGVITRVERPVYDLPASAGTGSFLDEGHFEKLSFPAGLVPEQAAFGVRVSGDSMEPVYHDGQIVWVEEQSHLKEGDVGIFVCDGEGFIKVYGEKDPDPDQLEEYTDIYGALHRQPVLILSLIHI